ncbi:hypothetical protein ABTZ58_19385 [Streptomyces sp. NPDC094143]|uniref:hypothetical protein n=1 Tax=Streptomyces sp. NPDC094143 TaxID=3155310 RepID=UPI0033271E8F
MSWDDVALAILAVSGCLTLLLAQISDVLAKLPQVIRAWREVRRELGGDSGEGGDSGFPGGPPSRDHWS